jgi:hypothetical protein
MLLSKIQKIWNIVIIDSFRIFRQNSICSDPETDLTNSRLLLKKVRSSSRGFCASCSPQTSPERWNRPRQSGHVHLQCKVEAVFHREEPAAHWSPDYHRPIYIAQSQWYAAVRAWPIRWLIRPNADFHGRFVRYKHALMSTTITACSFCPLSPFREFLSNGMTEARDLQGPSPTPNVRK